MHTVIETPTFLSDCRRAGLSENARLDIVDAIADDPLAGDVITGTGGARKRRFPGRGKGKSGGYRVISYYAGDDVPVLLLALVDKGERTDLTQSERNALATELRTYAREYRAAAAARAAKRRR
jgi:mRNA-degrading endonuclease RelE of RelBE toxin-antitoxin system